MNDGRVVYSVVWTVAAQEDSSPGFADHTLGVCEAEALDKCATTIVAHTDKNIAEFDNALYKSLKKAIDKKKSQTR